MVIHGCLLSLAKPHGSSVGQQGKYTYHTAEKELEWKIIHVQLFKGIKGIQPDSQLLCMNIAMLTTDLC